MLKCKDCNGHLKHVSKNIYKCQSCGNLYSVVNDDLEIANLDSLYEKARDLSQSDKEDDVSQAVSLFAALDDFSNSRELKEKYDRKLKEIKDRKKYLQQLMPLIAVACGVMAFIIFIVVFISSSNSSKKNAKYNQGVRLYKQGKYEESLKIFSDLDGYGNSDSYILKLEEIIEEQKDSYERGRNYYEHGQYGNAIEEFDSCKQYLDSMDYINDSSEKLYEQAKKEYDAKNYEKAGELLEPIPDYADIYNSIVSFKSEIDDTIEARKTQRKYDKAVELFNEKNYIEAQKMFLDLENYEKSRDYLDKIDEYYYAEAKKYYDNGDYVKCGDALQVVDEDPEWTQYSSSQNLMEDARKKYISEIKKEARNICRDDGEEKMNAYINSKECCLLTEDEAVSLKEECLIHKIPLMTLKPLEKNFRHEYSVTDSFGNNYDFALASRSNIEEYKKYETYNLNGAYRYLYATVAVDNLYKDPDNRAIGQIMIYGDDRLLWSATDLRPKTKPYKIKVDINKVNNLTIEMYGKNYTHFYLSTLLCDPVLSE